MNVDYFEIVIKVYHKEPVGRLRYLRNGEKPEVEESQMYSMSELNNLIHIWKLGETRGFGEGTKLEEDAKFQLVEE